MTDLQFRTAEPPDVPAVVALVESAYRGDASRQGWTTEADLLSGQRTDPEAVGELLRADGSQVLLAEVGSRILACCHLQKADAYVYFGMFAVDPPRQGGGLGRAVIAEAARRAVAWERPRIRMTVIRQRADLIAWYERLGFARTGATEPFPYGDERFGQPLRDDLEFAVLEGDAHSVLHAATTCRPR